MNTYDLRVTLRDGRVIYGTIEGRTVKLALRAARIDTRLRDARSIEVTVKGA